MSVITRILLFLLPLQVVAQADFTQYVDPFIGTDGHGHTFPGVSVPFGMVQLSPDTRLKGWDGCSGYHYSDNLVYGFSHTHLSGTGISDYGDVLLMPTVGKVELKNKHYASIFKKENESAVAGHYSVYLDEPGIRVDLTATARTGLHKYTFPKTGAANIILDLKHRDKVNDGAILISGDDELSGYRVSTSWATRQQIYFVIQFSKPFKRSGISNGCMVHERTMQQEGKKLKAFVQFDTEEGEVVYARVGISPVSMEGARKNLAAEQPDFDFERTKEAAQRLWNRELSKIEVEDNHLGYKRIFYTAMYHAMLAPNLYEDVDGSYLGRDRQIHRADSFDYHTVFSLWDTYRALHPLLTLIDRERSSDFINTFLKQYEQGGLLPVWELSSSESFCMIGYHAVPVIVDAYLKGISGFDAEAAFESMKKSAEISEDGLKDIRVKGSFLNNFMSFMYRSGFDDYLKNGYIRQRVINESVSKTLEYAYDDWCIAQMAKALGHTADHERYSERAANYRNLFDPATGFMRARKEKGFLRGFDPYKINLSYTEANAWQYSFYVPHDISGHMELLGGKEPFAAFLDSLFRTTGKTKGFGPISKDVSGLIGQYAHGNEPSHHIAYEYNYAGQPWKTQAMVRRIMDEMYDDQPDGMSGNEDCGQMSAWYIFSSLGFYPVCPGSDHYALGSPLFDKATIHLESGKSFTVLTTNNSEENVYIRSAKLNGEEYTKSYLTYQDIADGGVLEFVMDGEPNKNWGSGKGEIPVSKLE